MKPHNPVPMQNSWLHSLSFSIVSSVKLVEVEVLQGPVIQRGYTQD